jgi:hypothetical protein
LLLLREVDEHLGLSRAAVDAISIGKTLSASRTPCMICWLSACKVCTATTST